jgi:hypothetical protein
MRRLHVLSFLLYLALNVVIMVAGRVPAEMGLTFVCANTLPPALLGILVVKRYRQERSEPRGVLWHAAFGVAFATAVTAATLLIAWAGLPRGVFRTEPARTLWAFMINALIFAVIASAR